VCLNPALAQALASDRSADLRQAAAPRVRPPRDDHRANVILATRRATGWMLVDVGLRLAVPQRGLNRPAPGAHR
jgi:hypothetical protein